MTMYIDNDSKLKINQIVEDGIIANNKIKVIVVGNQNKEHNTYVERSGKYYKFYDDGYEGIPCDYIIEFLQFLGYEVFVVYKNKLEEPLQCINCDDFI